MPLAAFRSSSLLAGPRRSYRSLLLPAACLLLSLPGYAKGEKATLEVNPSECHLRLGEGIQLHGRVRGREGSVHWSVDGAGGGTISSDGFFQAPGYGTTPVRVKVIASSDGSPALRSEILVFLDPVEVSMFPNHVRLDTGQAVQFRAKVAGAGDQRVIWSVDGGPTHGSISDAGLFTAPAAFPTPGNVTVRVTSAADPTKSATASIRLERIEISIKSADVHMRLGQTHRFEAKVKGTANTGVAWEVVGEGNGRVSESGLYTTPASMATPAMVTIIARSIADPSKSAVARIRVDGVELNARGEKGRKKGLRAAVSAVYHVAAPRVVRILLPTDPLDAIVPGPDFRGKSGKQYVPLGGAVDLKAVVENSAISGIKWEITQPKIGSVTEAGTYNAPITLTTPQVVQVRATSLADPTKNVIVAVNIPEVLVQTPKQPFECALDGAVQLRAKVENSENDQITWTVEGGEANGTVSPNGLYHPPASISTPAVVRVKACSVADPTKCAYMVVDIPEVRLDVTPANADLRPGRSVRLRAKVQGTGSVGQVVWKLTPEIGSITPDGVYTAPEDTGPQVVQITASLAADPTKTATTTIRLRGR